MAGLRARIMIPALKPENLFWPEKGLSAKNKFINQTNFLIRVIGYIIQYIYTTDPAPTDPAP